MYKMKGFYMEKDGARELLAEEKNYLGGQSCKVPLLSMGGGEDPCDRLPYWCWTRKFWTD